MNGPPLIVVTLPARSLDEAREALPSLTPVGAGAAEIRFDRWYPAEVGRAASLFPSPIPLVATLRSREEGGGWNGTMPARTMLLRSLSLLPFAYLDLEVRSDGELIRELIGRPAGPALILSVHLPANATRREIEAHLAPPPARALLKIAVPASLGRLYAEIRQLLPRPPGEEGVTVLTTGSSGPILRALARRLALPLVYAAPPPSSNGAPAEPAVEPSQIPVDRLTRYFRGSIDAPLFAVLGHPVAYSVSPAIHSGWIEREHRVGLYVPLDIESAAELEGVLPRLAEDGFRGLNVTHPWKETALALADTASPAARATGCANTLSKGPRGWHADNFDRGAVARRLRELKHAGRWAGDRLLVLGGGGAARAALGAARDLRAEASIRARRPEISARLAREFEVRVAGPGRIRRPFPLVVHATPVGRSGSGELDLPWLGYLGPGTYFLDFVYQPDVPALRHAVVAAGGAYEDGSRILVYQAAETHQRWWGAPPAPELEAWALREVGCTG